MEPQSLSVSLFVFSPIPSRNPIVREYRHTPLLTSRSDKIYSPHEENILSLRKEYFTLARGIYSPLEENKY